MSYSLREINYALDKTINVESGVYDMLKSSMKNEGIVSICDVGIYKIMGLL